MKRIDLSRIQWQDSLAMALRQWRRLRRVHARRSDSERRILVIGAVAVAWLLADSAFLTPALARVKAATTRHNQVKAELSTKSAEAARYTNDLKMMTDQLTVEVEALRERVAKQREEIESFQSGLVPAREMRAVLQNMLAQTDGVRLMSVKTLSADEARKVLPVANEVPGLYRHAMDVTVSGPFQNLVDWLVSVEGMQRRLLWSGMTLALDEQQRLSLSVRLVTLSPDLVPLEISEP